MAQHLKRIWAVLVFAIATSCGLGLSADKLPVPDFTKGGKKDQMHDWNLGPTGARGWIWAWKGQTTDARQILVTDVAQGSPADGVLKKNDVLLGINGKPFSEDARIAFAKGITESERTKGVISLLRWRDGQTQNVDMKIPVLGSYSATAPYDCEKSTRILELGCAAIAKTGFKNKRGNIDISIPNDLKALALLASGRQEYRSQIAEYAAAVAAHTPGGHKSWGYAYETLFLAEYVNATQDKSVMPGLVRLSTDIALGQSGVGTWGHSFARASDGILNGYGCMNQPGIVLTLAMQTSKMAGVNSSDLDKAIAKSTRFLHWYAGKGAIPYGDHAPWPGHEDNGKCSSAAILFDLLGDRDAAAFFSRMGLAGYAERESGHTGNFFNILWALPGVSRCGPLATGAYFKETDWYYDFARGWDGRFIHQGIPGEDESYDNWDSTGAYMLAYALPLKSLLITGKKQTVVPPLSSADVTETIANGRWNFWSGQETFYNSRSTADLVKGLSSWSPTVRERSALALSKKSDVSLDSLVRSLDASDKETVYGACVALRHLGEKADAASPKLRLLLTSADPWKRVLAAQAIVELSEKVREAAIPDLLRVVTRKDDPEDPRRWVMGPLAEVLFKPGPGKREPDSILRKSLDKVDASNGDLLIAAIRDVLHSEDGRVRSGVSKVYSLLTPEQTAKLMPDIVEAIRKPAPSGEMFAYDIRMAGLELLAKLRIREGMDYCVDIMNEDRWGRDFSRAARALQLYGGAASPVLARLKSETRKIAKDKKEGNTTQLEVLDKLIAAIENDKNPKPLQSLQDFIAQPAHSK